MNLKTCAKTNYQVGINRIKICLNSGESSIFILVNKLFFSPVYTQLHHWIEGISLADVFGFALLDIRRIYGMLMMNV